MEYELKNKHLCVRISDTGAELFSIKTPDETEYLWQGDPAFWSGRAINLFPIVGKLYEGCYTYKGQRYELPNHGFLRHSTMRAQQKSADAIDFILSDNAETRAVYPFKFELTVSYSLIENRINCGYTLKNTGDEVMIFALGGHPGFNVPIDNGRFEDWYLQFDEGIKPTRVCLSASGYLSDDEPAYQLTDGKIPLEHGLFDNDAIILRNSGKRVTLKSDLSNRYVTVHIDPQFIYTGFWQVEKKPAPYVCIEPWTSLLDYEKPCAFETKRDMTRLQPAESFFARMDIEIG